MELYQNIIQTNYKSAKITILANERKEGEDCRKDSAAVRKQRPNLNGLK